MRDHLVPCAWRTRSSREAYTVPGRVRAAVAVLAGVAALGVPAAGAPPGVKVPAGFRVETFASGLTQPTAMAYGPDGRIYVTQTGGSLVAIRRGATHPQ